MDPHELLGSLLGRENAAAEAELLLCDGIIRFVIVGLLSNLQDGKLVYHSASAHLQLEGVHPYCDNFLNM